MKANHLAAVCRRQQTDQKFPRPLYRENLSDTWIRIHDSYLGSGKSIPFQGLAYECRAISKIGKMRCRSTLKMTRSCKSSFLDGKKIMHAHCTTLNYHDSS